MELFNKILICFCLICANSLYGQNENDSCYYKFDSITERNIYSITDIEPSYPGGIEEMKNFINKNIEYVDPGYYKATIYVSFTVEIDGRLTDIQIKKGAEKVLNNSAIDVIRKMPNWTPAKCNGHVVPCMALVPIRFE